MAEYDIADPNDPNTLVLPFIFVPHGDPWPTEWLRDHPGAVRIPATFVPRTAADGEATASHDISVLPPRVVDRSAALPPAAASGGFAPGGRLSGWPLDRHGNPWPRTCFGQPQRPLHEFCPGERAPGEAVPPEYKVTAQTEPVSAYQRAQATFADPGRVAGVMRLVADERAAPDGHSASSAQAQTHPRTWPGVEVRLPDGSRISDPDSKESPAGYLMSPVQDLTTVAAAGRQTRTMYLALASNQTSAKLADMYLFGTLGISLGHGGTFDYQRSGNFVTGYTQFRQFRDISNVNVGLFSQQAGLTHEQTLWIAGIFTQSFSSNSNPELPNGLDSRAAKYITTGFRIGESGVLGLQAIP